MPDTSARLLLVIHHLVVDGVSWRILLADLRQAYASARAGAPIDLLETSHGANVWARRLEAYAREQAPQIDYWSRLDGAPAAPPADYSGGTDVQSERRSIRVGLDRATTEALLKEAPAAYRTKIDDILLTALARALRAASGRDRILVDLEGHGREEIDPTIDLSRSVGWFTSLYPVALDASGAPHEALKRVKEALRAVPDRGLGYGALLHKGDATQRQSLERLPRADVLFNYLGQFDGSFDEDSPWRPAEESPGPSRDERAPLDYRLAVNGQIYDGALRLDVGYSAARYRRETIEAFAEFLRAELEALIAHCRGGARGATPSDFPLCGLTQAQIDRLPVPLEQIDDLYPATPMQAGMIFDAARDPSSLANIVQMEAFVDDFDTERFLAAWRSALRRHAVLRSSFHSVEGSAPIQIVRHEVDPAFVLRDLRGHGAAELEWKALVDNERTLGFDFRAAPLTRLVAARWADRRWRLVWTWHHILLDGWSMSRLLGEIQTVYAGGDVEPPVLRYGDHVRALLRRAQDSDAAYWRDALRATPATLLAPCFTPAEAVDRAAGHGVERRRIDAAPLQRFAASQQVTLNTLAQAAWTLLLRRHVGKDEIVFGVTVAGRSTAAAGLEKLIGLCINTLPLAQRVAPERLIGDWLRALQAQNLELRQREHTPLYEIKRWAGRPGAPLFDTVMLFENYPIDAASRGDGDGKLILSQVRSSGATSLPMTVVVIPGAEATLSLEYSRRCFTPEAARSLLDEFAQLLVGLAQDASAPLASLCAPVATSVPDAAPLRTDVTPDRSDEEMSEIELQVAALWSEILGVETIGPEDDFFALGGHSIAALRMVGTWSRSGAVGTLTIADIYRDARLRAVAACCAPLSDDRPVLYCFPARPWSQGEEFRDLVETFGAKVKIEPLACPTGDELPYSQSTIERLADRYADIVRRGAAPSYAFLGWSIGGLLAFETARRLSDGEAPRFVGLVDVPTFSGYRALLAQAATIPEASFEPIEKALSVWLAGSRMKSQWAALLSQLDAVERRAFLAEAGRALATGMTADGPGPQSREHQLWSRLACLRLASNHRPQPGLAAPLFVWTAGKSVAAGAERVDWRGLSMNVEAERTIVGAAHEDILASAEFIQDLTSALETLRQKN
jgi:non-ribosomal peptide synthase protein (TIGR01720 family)